MFYVEGKFKNKDFKRKECSRKRAVDSTRCNLGVGDYQLM